MRTHIGLGSFHSSTKSWGIATLLLCVENRSHDVWSCHMTQTKHTLLDPEAFKVMTLKAKTNLKLDTGQLRLSE